MKGDKPWKKVSCIHYYEYYTFLSSVGLVSMPCCDIHCFNCVDCTEYEVENCTFCEEHEESFK